MQLINVGLISDAERQDGDGKCQIAVRYADGTEQMLYARQLPGNDVADDCFLAGLIEANEHLPEARILTPLGGGPELIVQWDAHHNGRTPRVTFYPRF